MKILLLSLFLISSIFFSVSSGIDALTPGWNPPSDYREDSSLKTFDEPNDDNQEIDGTSDQKSLEDLFGSEQVFPFEPGFS